MNEWGKTFTWDVKSKMMGRRAPDAAQILIDSYGIPLTPEEFLDREKAISHVLWPSVLALPGAAELVLHLNENSIPSGLATSTHREYFELKSKGKDFFRHFQCIVVGNDPEVKQGKPHPDIFLEAAKRMGVEPGKHILVFEDALNGVDAALAAGMSVVAVPHPSFDKTLFHHADQVLESLDKFEPHQWLSLIHI
eukprot:TRINITY_DN387_c0_g1_i7.p1 TRINITY_DN387_c0_g1~~TRINITY_DN387_c0_g1_i7.p1  ORF type:complete len:194 (-),score=58.87 TRINITY_DN387_c0_g1_i7:46-627(-)